MQTLCSLTLIHLICVALELVLSPHAIFDCGDLPLSPREFLGIHADRVLCY